MQIDQRIQCIDISDALNRIGVAHCIIQEFLALELLIGLHRIVCYVFLEFLICYILHSDLTRRGVFPKRFDIRFAELARIVCCMRIVTLIVIVTAVVTSADVVGDQLIVGQSSCVRVVIGVKLILCIQVVIVVVLECSRILVTECVVVIIIIIGEIDRIVIVIVVPDVS